MAERIYDQTMGQLAGVEVTTTGNSTPTRNGLEAYAQMVVSASGQPISSTEGSGNLVDLSGATVAAGSLSFSANNQYAIIDTQGFEGASFTISGFGTATLAVQWSNLAASGFVAGLVGTVGTTSTATTITANGQYTAASGGRYLKILVTAFTTGPIVVTPVLIAGSSVGGGGGGAAGDVNLTQVAGTAVTSGAGAVTAGTQRTTLASDDPAVTALEALVAATATINVGQDSSVMFLGATAVTPKFAVISASSSGDNTIVTGVASKKIRVLAFRVNGSAAVNWKFQSSTGGDITGLFYCVSGGQGEIGAFSPVGLFQTVAGEDLQLNLSGAVAVGGYVVYIEV